MGAFRSSSGGGPAPVELPANQPPRRFYRGGAQIAAFRGTGPAEPYTPEDWVGSTVPVRGEDGRSGLTRLRDGRLLRDAIAADPTGWLGKDHVERFGADPRLLVKLLDAGQRLPIHAHPDGPFAAEALGTAHGKAEAWYMLSGGEVYLGLTRDLSTPDLRRLVEQQRTLELLEAMHRITVEPGDRVFVPPGYLHAIGEGVLLTEVQEPEDLSILLEWNGFELDGAKDGHLGLGFEHALTAVRRHSTGKDELDRLVRRADSASVGLPEPAAPFFRLDRMEVDGDRDCAPGFAILIGLAGSLALAAAGGMTSIRRGTVLLLPAAAGTATLIGHGSVLEARPPLA
jgi:mannose-6-phosphate isomerase